MLPVSQLCIQLSEIGPVSQDSNLNNTLGVRLYTNVVSTFLCAGMHDSTYRSKFVVPICIHVLAKSRSKWAALQNGRLSSSFYRHCCVTENFWLMREAPNRSVDQLLARVTAYFLLFS